MAGPDYSGQASDIIGQAGAAGSFSPYGSPGLNFAIRQNAIRNAGNMQRRSALLSRLMGLDPNQARVAQVGADTAASANTSGTLNDAYLQQLQGNQNFARGLFNNQLGLQNQEALYKYQHDLNRPTAGDYFGQILGQGAGSFLGGWGSQLGRRMAGGRNYNADGTGNDSGGGGET
jgi:hypothetical protein